MTARSQWWSHVPVSLTNFVWPTVAVFQQTSSKVLVDVFNTNTKFNGSVIKSCIYSLNDLSF